MQLSESCHKGASPFEVANLRIKTIKQGKSKWLLQKVCKSCESVLVVEEDDILYEVTD